MQSIPSSEDNVHEYPALPSALEGSPQWRAAQEQNEQAQLAEGRLRLGCFMFWLSNGGFLVTGLPPMGDMRGGRSWMVIYTAEYLIRVDGENLHLLAWEMKQQRIDSLGVTEPSDAADGTTWAVTSITASERSED